MSKVIKFVVLMLKNLIFVRRGNCQLLFSIFLLFSGMIQGCSDKTNNQIRLPSTELYHQAMISIEDEYYNEALKNFEILVDEYAGTRLATLAHLKMGDIYLIQSKWEESETSYRQFLLLNQRSHLTPYVLNRLIALNYERNHYGIFFKSRDYDRNMEPNRTLIKEYQRFYLLFPKSPYLEQVKEYHSRAMFDLAEHELNVANYYFDKQSYHSAIGRYLYLLKNFPSFPRTVNVAERLIDAYRLNRQPELADEMQRVLDSLRERNLLAQHNSKEE